MPYTALPDMRIPFDNDGSAIYQGTPTNGADTVLTGAQAIELNDDDQTQAFARDNSGLSRLYMFFPEQREVTAIWAQIDGYGLGTVSISLSSITGSNDTVNGEDGTWETASLPGGAPVGISASGATGQIVFDYWRSGIKPISFTGAKKNVRITISNSATSAGPGVAWQVIHLYGEKTAGQTPDDLIYIDHDTTPGVEYASPEDFGDQPLGTTVVRQFRLKNTSATKTANTINIQCNDSDFAISTDGTTWVVTINIASLGPGAQSATMYVRCTTPAPGNPLGPRFARIVTTVASYT